MSATAEFLPRSDGRTTCKRGHPWTYENVWLPRYKPTHRGHCLVCQRELREARQRGERRPRPSRSKPPPITSGTQNAASVKHNRRTLDARGEALAGRVRAAHADPTVRVSFVEPWSLKPRPEPVAQPPRIVHPNR
jgi:hypothetical protein